MPETFSAAAGMAASLDAQIRADSWDGVSHTLGPVFGRPPAVFAACSCSRRIDGADVEQVTALHRAHVEMEQEAAERAECARTAPEGLARARAALTEVADRRPEGER
jgi:hypothetical protein